MISKVKAAQQAIFAGITTFIADGASRTLLKGFYRTGNSRYPFSGL